MAEIKTSSMNTVFGVPELLTAIFMELPLGDVILAANVWSAWYNLISTSETLHNRVRQVLIEWWDLSKVHPADHFPFEQDAELTIGFTWGIVVLRRQNDFEAFAAFSSTDNHRWFTVVNGWTKTLTIQPWRKLDTDPPSGWKLRFHDKEAGRSHEGVIFYSNARSYWSIVSYLWYFHAEESVRNRKSWLSSLGNGVSVASRWARNSIGLGH